MIIGGEEAVATATFDVIAEDGTVIQPLPIARRGRAVPGQSEFLGMITVPAQPFRILLTGQSVDGRRFLRLYERLFRPGRGSLDIPPDAFIPLEYDGQRRLMDEDAKRQLAEVESYVAANAAVPLVMPRIEVSKVMYAPLLSAAGRTLGLRITYDVEFSQDGLYDPQLRVHPENAKESSGVSAQMRVLNSSLDPIPRLDYAPYAPANTRTHDSVLAYGADFLYDARTIYHFTVELVPDFISARGGEAPCVLRQSFQTAADPDKAFAKMMAREAPTTYRLWIGGTAFEGRVDRFPEEGTLYRSFLAEGAQDCAK
ncbi:MAG: hypothetical protein ABIQ52_10530 [Vicinamibacterales bacterium]